LSREEKDIQRWKRALGKLFSTFLSLGKKSGKELSLGNLFSTFEYPFFPGTIFFSGTR
jgi:hypothetical protein